MNEEIKKEIDALKKEIKILKTKIVNNKARVGADAPVEYKTIQELELATYNAISLTSVLAVENDSGTFKITMQDLIKSISYLQSLTDLDRNLWQDVIPIGFVIPSFTQMLSEDESSVDGFRNLGNWLPCNGQIVQRIDYPNLFEAWGVQSSLTEIAIPNINGIGVDGGDGYFLRGTDPTIRAFGISEQQDSMQSLSGTIGNIYSESGTSSNGLLTLNDKVKGLDAVVNNSGTTMSTHEMDHYNLTFNNSGVVRTSSENRPKNIAVGYYIKVDNKYI